MSESLTFSNWRQYWTRNLKKNAGGRNSKTTRQRKRLRRWEEVGLWLVVFMQERKFRDAKFERFVRFQKTTETCTDFPINKICFFVRLCRVGFSCVEHLREQFTIFPQSSEKFNGSFCSFNAWICGKREFYGPIQTNLHLQVRIKNWKLQNLGIFVLFITGSRIQKKFLQSKGCDKTLQQKLVVKGFLMDAAQRKKNHNKREPGLIKWESFVL